MSSQRRLSARARQRRGRVRSARTQLFACLIAMLLLGAGSAGAAAGQKARLRWHVETAAGAVLASHQADRALNPASLVKVATSLWALDTLGLGHRFTTRFVRRGDDLLVIGGGDPDFHLENAFLVAEALEELGVAEVPGRLLVTEAFWIGWNRRAPEDTAGAPSMAARLRQAWDPARWSRSQRQAWTRLAERTGRDPARPPSVAIGRGVGDMAIAALQGNGAPSPGSGASTRQGSDVSGEGGMVTLLEHRSRPLAETLRRFNAYSNNDIARLEVSLGPVEELAGLLSRRWGPAAAGLELATTSGLGRNRLTLRQVVRLLHDFQQLAAASGLRVEELLPVAGCDPGTLESFPLLAEGELAASVAAKTGTLTRTDGGIALLAGYAATARGDVVFAVAAPGAGGRLAQARGEQQRWLAEQIARMGGPRARSCAGPFPQAGDNICIVPAAARPAPAETCE